MHGDSAFTAMARLLLPRMMDYQPVADQGFPFFGRRAAVSWCLPPFPVVVPRPSTYWSIVSLLKRHQPPILEASISYSGQADRSGSCLKIFRHVLQESSSPVVLRLSSKHRTPKSTSYYRCVFVPLKSPPTCCAARVVACPQFAYSSGIEEHTHAWARLRVPGPPAAVF